MKEKPRQDPDRPIIVIGPNTIVDESSRGDSYIRSMNINTADLVVRRGFWRTGIGTWLGNKLGREERIVWKESPPEPAAAPHRNR